MESVKQFYASLVPFYHLIYPNWDASIWRQAFILDSVINERWGKVSEILDVSCGIGTQAIGLAKLGYDVTGSDLSHEEIQRAAQESTVRNLTLSLSAADMRYAHDTTCQSSMLLSRLTTQFLTCFLMMRSLRHFDSFINARVLVAVAF